MGLSTPYYLQGDTNSVQWSIESTISRYQVTTSSQLATKAQKKEDQSTVQLQLLVVSTA